MNIQSVDSDDMWGPLPGDNASDQPEPPMAQPPQMHPSQMNPPPPHMKS